MAHDSRSPHSCEYCKDLLIDPSAVPSRGGLASLKTALPFEMKDALAAKASRCPLFEAVVERMQASEPQLLGAAAGAAHPTGLVRRGVLELAFNTGPGNVWGVREGILSYRWEGEGGFPRKKRRVPAPYHVFARRGEFLQEHDAQRAWFRDPLLDPGFITYSSRFCFQMIRLRCI